jgi:hypothetical protein
MADAFGLACVFRQYGTMYGTPAGSPVVFLILGGILIASALIPRTLGEKFRLSPAADNPLKNSGFRLILGIVMATFAIVVWFIAR